MDSLMTVEFQKDGQNFNLQILGLKCLQMLAKEDLFTKGRLCHMSHKLKLNIVDVKFYTMSWRFMEGLKQLSQMLSATRNLFSIENQIKTIQKCHNELYVF